MLNGRHIYLALGVALILGAETVQSSSRNPDFALSSDPDTAPKDAMVTLAQSALSNL